MVYVHGDLIVRLRDHALSDDGTGPYNANSGLLTEAAEAITRQRTLITDMMTVMMNRLYSQDPKVKALLIKAVQEDRALAIQPVAKP